MPAQPEEIGHLEDPLIQAYREAWTDVLAQQQKLVDDPLQAVKRERLAGIREAIEDTMEEMDAAARAWIQSNLPQVFGLGAATGAADAGVGSFVWNAIAEEAVEELALRLYDNLKNAHAYVNESTRKLISEVVRNQSLKTAIQGRTATDAAREMRKILEVKGISAVRYADGSRHGLSEYSRMAIRTETATAYNSGTLHGAGKDCKYFQIADGPECGLSFHNDPTLALGMVVDRDTAARYLISHPNCRRAFGPRPDVKTAEEAKAAESFITDEQTKAQRAADQAAKARQRRVAQSKARVGRREASRTKTKDARTQRLAARQQRLSPNQAVEGLDVPLAPHGTLPKAADVLTETAVSKVPTIAQLIDKGWDPAKAEGEYLRLLKNARNVDRRARDKLLGRKPGSDAPAPELDPIQKLIDADATSKLDQPTVLHSLHKDGPGGFGRWEKRLVKDTGPGEYIPVRKLEMEGYTIQDGIAVRRNGTTYVFETPPGSAVTQAMKDEFETHIATASGALDSVPASFRGYQKGIAITRGNNPSDAHWAKEFSKPDFKSSATGGQGRTIFWNTQPRPGVVLHEFGHTLDDALGAGPGSTLSSIANGWKKAQYFDSATGEFHNSSGFQGSVFGHEMTPGSLGVTKYGAESISEDFAESVRLYLSDRFKGYLGYTKVNGVNTSVRFADVFPARAAFLDKALGLDTLSTPFHSIQVKKALKAFVDADGALESGGLQAQFGVSFSEAHTIVTDTGHKAIAAAKEAAAQKIQAQMAAEVLAAQKAAADKVLTKADLSFADKTGIGVKKSNAIKKAKAAGKTDAEAQAIGVEVEQAEIQIRLQRLAAEGRGVVAGAQKGAAGEMRTFQSGTRAKAATYLNGAGTTKHPLAKEFGYRDNQAKANIAASIAERLNNDADWATFLKAYPDSPHGINATKAQRQAALDSEVSSRVSGWAASSGDHQLDPVTMQRAIKEEFGATGDYLARGESTFLTRAQVDANYARKGEWFRKVARRMYENTQDDLKAQGITHVSVFRGMNFGPRPAWAKMGTRDKPLTTRPLLQPANSWSTNESTSKSFGNTMFRAEIPIDRILGSARTGFGCLSESEFVIFDSEGLAEIYNANT